MMRRGFRASAKRMGESGSPWGTPVRMGTSRGSEPRAEKRMVVSDRRNQWAYSFRSLEMLGSRAWIAWCMRDRGIVPKAFAMSREVMVRPKEEAEARVAATAPWMDSEPALERPHW